MRADALADALPTRKDPLEWFLLEEMNATSIGNVAVDALLTYKYNASVLAELTYQFVNHDPRQHLFSIDHNTSIISTAQRIDRDTICRHQVDCLVWLHVGVFPETYSETIRILANIMDINDHQPTFPQPELNIHVAENIEQGRRWALPPAQDDDSEKFNIKDYELRNDFDGTFELEVTSDDMYPSPKELAIVLRKPLDREEQAAYDLKVVAYDGGVPPRSGSIVIHVIVDDVNDNNPKFANATYEFNVMENVEAGTTLGQVHAQDKDEGDNARVTYILTSESEQMFGGLFGITDTTGMIYQRVPLDFEEGQTYLLTVAALDTGSSQPAHCVVIVRVLDANDNSPMITLNTPDENRRVRISETTALGGTVAQLTVSDLDGGENGQVDCTMVNAYFSLEMTYQSQYRVISTAPLRSAVSPEVELTVICRDMGNPPNTAQENLYIEIVASNTHPPVFSQTVYFGVIRENNAVNEEVLVVMAEDEDAGNFGQVRYILDPSATSDFRLDTMTGRLTANRVFDYEREIELRFTVIAYDLGLPQLSSTATINVQVLDEDDSVPRFTRDHYEFGVVENHPALTIVGTVALQPIPAGLNTGPFLYSFASPGSMAAQVFSLSAVTGRITTRTVLDREVNPVYYLAIVARNEGQPPMTGTVSVTVFVSDLNDNPPLIQFPREQNYTVSISRGTPVGHSLTTIRATDADIGDNGKIKYTITRGNEYRLFEIGLTSGVVIVRGDLTSVTQDFHSLTIQVGDHGFPQQFAYTRLNVLLNQTLPFPLSDPSRAVVSQDNATAIISVTAAALVIVFLVLFSIMMYLVWRRFSPRDGNKKDERCCYSNVSPPIPFDEGPSGVQVDNDPETHRDNRLNTQIAVPQPIIHSTYTSPRNSFRDSVGRKPANTLYPRHLEVQPSPAIDIHPHTPYTRRGRTSTSTFKVRFTITFNTLRPRQHHYMAAISQTTLSNAFSWMKML